jgi:putative nucleotidyltransferase with HDIG domain
MNLMFQYNKNDVRRINHALKVFALAQSIARAENCDERTQEIIECAAILHDIGIYRSEQISGAENLEFHEDIGVRVARELIDGLEIDSGIKERVYFLVGNHHQYKKITGIDFRILVEADLIVSMYEDEFSRDVIQNARKTVFRTKTGRALLDSMYLSAPPVSEN